jgi:hypothetical protein
MNTNNPLEKTCQTQYCQIVSSQNRLKRFIYACIFKMYNEDLFDAIMIDECTAELRQYTSKMYVKGHTPLLRKDPKHTS